MRVGFIGLGNMGEPHGSKSCLRRASMSSATTSSALAPKGSSRLPPGSGSLRILRNRADHASGRRRLKSVASEVLPGMMPGSILLDCSTVDIDSALEVNAAAKSANLDLSTLRSPAASAARSPGR